MAKFFPPIPEDFNGSLAEERIYELFKKLPDRIRVFHSYKWMASEHYRYTREGEADFIIYDPENGILCAEVKGGGISYKSGQWWQKDNKSERVLNTNPWSQAKNASHFIRRLLKRLSPNVSIPVYPMLWFPDVIMHGNVRFPEEVPKYAVLTKDHTLNPKTALESLINVWGRYKIDQGLQIKLEPGFSENLPEILLPSLELIPASNLSAEENDRQYFRFTKEQFKILEFIEGENRVGIAGGAGSGKTIIAREYAKRISETGDNVLVQRKR
ncbi:NERD domain-containing protein/DEAD/DEAH box helicase [Leptospira levettii]|uniref:nuclease-related domain-containing protein n=1 Tax=Leptospira levettii TaxID=2023178 RepID=UPI00223DCD5C|nr:NERD domain-containing protein/DEAD/DEAH box helicase [Leptospira levettii]MCW7509744.1 NERD domain-containing protein/DEAD/DEAH box helicase [Leptospira levettii]MCW7520831.1 NERD domain-containing protein/DEAD/DEAH box helicase [Leptospira levettii]